MPRDVSSDSAPQTLTLHASAISFAGRGLLILGQSGAGKSSLALELMAFGATLVADDQVAVTPQPDQQPLMTAPAAIAGLIEARGIGLLRHAFKPARLTDAVDLDREETMRLPEARETVIAGCRIPCLSRVEHPAFAAMVFAYLKGGRAHP